MAAFWGEGVLANEGVADGDGFGRAVEGRLDYCLGVRESGDGDRLQAAGGLSGLGMEKMAWDMG